jgi:hypothetical protein
LSLLGRAGIPGPLILAESASSLRFASLAAAHPVPYRKNLRM